MNARSFPALLQARREVMDGYQHLGWPNDGRGFDLAIFAVTKYGTGNVGLRLTPLP
jgi:hypothetical protein